MRISAGHLLAPSFLVLVTCGHPAPPGGPVDAGAVEEPPPPICRTPAPPAGSWFTEVTSEMGLGTAAAPRALANSVYAGDFDGDGYADLLSSLVPANRETGATRYHFLLLNRPDPKDPKRRVFVDATAESGLGATRDGKGGRGFTVAFLGDLDNNGTLDVITCPGDANAEDECAAFLNDGSAHFKLAAASELEGSGVFQVDSGTLLDADRDGRLDFWPGTFGVAPSLFRGAGDGTFRDVAGAAGLPTKGGDPREHKSFRRTFGVTACDLDGDGDLDVILADYGREANQVWRNDGAPGQMPHFTEIGHALGVDFDDRMDFRDDESYRCWCMQNAAKCPDKLPAPRITCPPGPNERVWELGVSDQPFRLGGNHFGITCGDIDDDGDLDLMTATIVHWDVGSSSDPSELLLNDTPPGSPLLKFRRPGNQAMGLARAHSGGWNDGDMMPVFADVDLDGRKDIYLTSSDYPGDHGWLWRQKPDHTFEDVTAVSGVGQKQIHGVALVDLDNDGDLDLVAGTSTARSVSPNNALRVYRNDVADTANFTQIVLHGLGAGHSNRSAIGARVSVTALLDGQRVTQLQEVQGGHSHEAVQNGFVLTFGLGPSCAIESVVVRWPDAQSTVQTFKDVRPNYRIEITEGAGRIKYIVPR